MLGRSLLKETKKSRTLAHRRVIVVETKGGTEKGKNQSLYEKEQGKSCLTNRCRREAGGTLTEKKEKTE